jgi:hypothetical protein
MRNSDPKNYYQTKAEKITGRRYTDVRKSARNSYAIIERRTNRNPYVRSAYFKKEKVFVNLFWQHIMQKHEGERKKRLRYFDCAIELLEKTTLPPITKRNPNGRNELVHRFNGMTPTGEIFYVQIKEEVRTGRKYFMSVFPEQK